MDSPRWIWQKPHWPHFRWQAETLAPLLRDCQHAQGRLLGMAGAVAGEPRAQDELDTLLQNIITSSAIEGESLNVGSVRSSLARRLGVAADAGARPTPRSEGLAELMFDAIQHSDTPLDMPRLLHWHVWLFPQPDTLLAHPVRVGRLRGDEPMQVVSGRIDRPTVHFEAPPRAGLETELNAFLDWFNASRGDTRLDPLLREGIWEVLRELADAGKTVLLSSHVMDEAMRCDEVILLRDGRLVGHMTPQELLDSTGTTDADAAFLALIKRDMGETRRRAS